MTTTANVTPTLEQLGRLAETFHHGNEDRAAELFSLFADWEDWCDECPFTVTRESLDDFRSAARASWKESRGRVELEGGIFWEVVQTHKGKDRVSVAVFDCGDFRLAYKQ